MKNAFFFNLIDRKKTLFLLFISLTVLLSILYYFYLGKTNNGHKIIYIKGHPLLVEIAETPEAKTKGLSGRAELDSTSGMLFVFEKSGYYHFWMKNMLFPLDFIWINGNKVVDLTENVSLPVAIGEKLSTFTSSVPADKVLEVNAGTVETLNIDIGDKVIF